MLIDKQNNKVISGNKDSVVKKPETPDLPVVVVPEQVASNGPMDVLKAMKEILRSVVWQWGVPDSPKIFKTCKLTMGSMKESYRRTEIKKKR